MTTIYPWQHGAWEQLQLLRPRMPHAILFHGAAGTGKADHGTMRSAYLAAVDYAPYVPRMRAAYAS